MPFTMSVCLLTHLVLEGVTKDTNLEEQFCPLQNEVTFQTVLGCRIWDVGRAQSKLSKIE